MRQRGLVAVRRRDGDRQAVRRHLTRERDFAGDRGDHDRRPANGDVDAAVLAGGILVVSNRELAQHGAVDRPGPRERTLSLGEHTESEHDNQREESRCP